MCKYTTNRSFIVQIPKKKGIQQRHSDAPLLTKATIFLLTQDKNVYICNIVYVKKSVNHITNNCQDNETQ